jgi:N-acetylmuramoyl-L-alanine amidase
VEEKRVVLDVAKRARVHLANTGCAVYLTRESDRYLALDQRCSRARSLGADIFVSLHLNASTGRTASGPETYILSLPGFGSTNSHDQPSSNVYPANRWNGANMVLGYALQKALAKNNEDQEDRGVRRARFEVLRSAPCPAALVEFDFVSNHRVEDRLIDAKTRDRLAKALAQGIMDYRAEVTKAQLSP